MPPIDIPALVIALLVLIFSLTVHEAAHAWSASRLGDDTARRLGRVTLNPIVHVDPIGTLLLPRKPVAGCVLTTIGCVAGLLPTMWTIVVPLILVALAIATFKQVTAGVD